MKKFLAVLFVLAICVTGVFAADTDFPTGTWVDAKWDASWVFSTDKVELFDKDGELVFTFTQNNTKDFKLTPSKDGLVLSFYCAEPGAMAPAECLEINPDWTDEDYKVTIKFKKLNF